MKNDGKVVEFPTEAQQPAIPTQDEKIVIFQLVSPNSCVFLCLSVEEQNNRLDIGMIRR